MPRYMHHKYEWAKPFGTPRHQWSLVGPDGGLHFHVSGPHKPEYGEWSCGLEIHHASKQGDSAPHQTKCWLIGGPCWHDGISLYAEETLWPIIKSYLRDGDHETIFRLLEGEADNFFGYNKRVNEE